jgi:hypothetical protein
MDPNTGTYHVLLVCTGHYPSAPRAGCIQRYRRDRAMRGVITRDNGPRAGRAAPSELWMVQTATVVIYREGHAPVVT